MFPVNQQSLYPPLPHCSGSHPNSRATGKQEPMGSEAVVLEELPQIPLIRTTLIRDGTAGAPPLEETPTSPDVSKQQQQQQQQEEVVVEEGTTCETPKQVEKTQLVQLQVCPPTPRKPRQPKRKRVPPPGGFFVVPHDLTLVFLPLSGPPNKIIRAG